MAARGYEDTEIYKLAKKLVVEIHKMTLAELPKYEMFAEGDQIRRSSKSIVANFVEGYGRRRYPPDHIRFLTYAVSTCDETKAHLEMLHETECLKPERFQYLCRIPQVGRDALQLSRGRNQRRNQGRLTCDV